MGASPNTLTTGEMGLVISSYPSLLLIVFHHQTLDLTRTSGAVSAILHLKTITHY